MKLHVLGCHGPYPPAGGATSGYLVEQDGKLLLMDCGSGVLGRLMQKADPAKLSGILLSHLHYDHAADLLVLTYYLQQRGVKLPLFVPPEDASPLRKLLSADVYDVMPYPEKMQLAGLGITTLPVRHPVPCRAIRLEAEGKALVFSGDTNTCENLAAFAKEADAFLCDAAFLETEWAENKPHLSAKKAAEAALQAHVKQLYLTHLPVGHEKATMEQEASSVFAHTKAVEQGLVISL